jgi:hypothetical protein
MELFYNFIDMIKQKIFNTNIEPDESPQYVAPQYVQPTIEDLNRKINEMNTIIFNKNKVIDERSNFSLEKLEPTLLEKTKFFLIMN